MLKKRIVACLTIKNGIVVQSIGFKKYLPVGSPMISAEALNQWGIDEIIILDLDATREKRKPNLDLVKAVSKKIFVPLTVGGGIQNEDDIRKLISSGADKVSINKSSWLNPEIISRGAKMLGSQCIAVSIDVKIKPNKGWEVVCDSGQTSMKIGPVEWAQKVEKLGAGEILLNSVDKDGSKAGYDINLIRKVSRAVSIPVIACGGAGHPEHFWQGIVQGEASAVAAGNFFHFEEHSPIIVKAYLARKGIKLRLDSYAAYQETDFQTNGRLAKRSEDYLDKLRFKIIKEEVI